MDSLVHTGYVTWFAHFWYFFFSKYHQVQISFSYIFSSNIIPGEESSDVPAATAEEAPSAKRQKVEE